MAASAVRLREILRDRHHLRAGRDDDFTIQNQAELLRAQEETQRSFATLTLGVASLSLAVGGVGILAVMLLSVKERVRELACGAPWCPQGRHPLSVPLEAMMLSVAGGLAGILLGVTATLAVAYAAGWDAVLAERPSSSRVHLRSP